MADVTNHDSLYSLCNDRNNIKHDPPPNLKISPIAAIPHKSRDYRMILDLSYGVKVNGTRMPSVNESTNPTVAPANSMAELGNVLPQIIYAMGTAPASKGPILFSKLDIKDGYWRMVVPQMTNGTLPMPYPCKTHLKRPHW
jgi:hypothetical protein